MNQAMTHHFDGRPVTLQDCATAANNIRKLAAELKKARDARRAKQRNTKQD